MVEDTIRLCILLTLLLAPIVAFFIVKAMRVRGQREDIQEVFEGDKYRIEFNSNNPFIPSDIATLTVVEVKRNSRGTIWCRVVDKEGCESHLTQEDLLRYCAKI